MKKREVFLKHIIDECNYLIERSESLSYEEFVLNPDLTRSFIRSLEIIGEAARNIPDELKSNYPNIPWEEMEGIRNKLIHEYFGVDLKIVWETVKKDIPHLKLEVERILEYLNKNSFDRF